MTENTFENTLKEAVCELVEQELTSFPTERELRQMYHLSDMFYERMEKLLVRMERKQRARIYLKKGLFAVACLSLMILIWKPQLLVEARDAIWKWFNTHVHFTFGDFNEEPKAQQYQMTYVPEGYEIVTEEYVGNYGFITCEDVKENRIELIYTFGENDANIDNKEKKLSVSYDEEGRAVYFLESTIGEDNVLIWELRDERISFLLFAWLDFEEMQKIKQGIRPKDR